MSTFGYSIIDVQLALGYALSLGIVIGLFVSLIRFLLFDAVERRL
jgi:hypothetical protein